MGISTLVIINKDNVVLMNILDLILPCNAKLSGAVYCAQSLSALLCASLMISSMPKYITALTEIQKG